MMGWEARHPPMPRRRNAIAAYVTAWLTLSLAVATAARADDASDFFEKKVRPVLVEHCYKCHSAESKKLKGDLRLDTQEGLLKGGTEGAVVVAGDPDKSRLIEAIRYTNPQLQ